LQANFLAAAKPPPPEKYPGNTRDTDLFLLGSTAYMGKIKLRDYHFFPAFKKKSSSISEIPSH
jgi:hypothetical protein